MYMHAWKSGLKTTYYLRSTAASTIEKSTVSNQKKEYSKEEAAACSIEAMRNGEECEACQQIISVIISYETLMNIEIKKLHDHAYIPSRNSSADAGYDLYAIGHDDIKS